MPLVPINRHRDVIDLAMSQVGIKEQPPKSNRGPDVDKFTGGRAEPWCAHYVAWLFRTCGKPLPDDAGPNPQGNVLASVKYLESVFKARGWLKWPCQPGDLVFYATRGLSDPGKGRHVGLIVAVDGDSFTSVEGNWGDVIAKRTLKIDDKRIVSFGRVP